VERIDLFCARCRERDAATRMRTVGAPKRKRLVVIAAVADAKPSEDSSSYTSL